MTLAEWGDVLVARHDYRAKIVRALHADLEAGVLWVLPPTHPEMTFCRNPIGLAEGIFA